jgi:predicted nucleic acid-binding protein
VATFVIADTSAILAVLLDEPEKTAIIDATIDCILCAPGSIRWEVGNAAVAAVRRRRLTAARAQQLLNDFATVPIQEIDVDIDRAVELALDLGIYAYDAYVLEAARSSGYDLLALDGAVMRSARKMHCE